MAGFLPVGKLPVAAVRLPATGTNYPIVIGTGTFAVTGQSVTLRATRRLVVGTGTFTVSGQAVRLLKGFRLVVGTATFSVSGQSVSFSRGFRLAVGTGLFTVAGQTISLRATRRMPIGTGVFVVTGRDLALYAVFSEAKPVTAARTNILRGDTLFGAGSSLTLITSAGTSIRRKQGVFT